jgi:hypothetical protein
VYRGCGARCARVSRSRSRCWWPFLGPPGVCAWLADCGRLPPPQPSERRSKGISLRGANSRRRVGGPSNRRHTEFVSAGCERSAGVPAKARRAARRTGRSRLRWRRLACGDAGTVRAVWAMALRGAPRGKGGAHTADARAGGFPDPPVEPNCKLAATNQSGLGDFGPGQADGARRACRTCQQQRSAAAPASAMGGLNEQSAPSGSGSKPQQRWGPSGSDCSFSGAFGELVSGTG